MKGRNVVYGKDGSLVATSQNLKNMLLGETCESLEHQRNALQS